MIAKTNSTYFETSQVFLDGARYEEIVFFIDNKKKLLRICLSFNKDVASLQHYKDVPSQIINNFRKLNPPKTVEDVIVYKNVRDKIWELIKKEYLTSWIFLDSLPMNYNNPVSFQ